MGRVEIVTFTVGARAKEGKRGVGGEKSPPLFRKFQHGAFASEIARSKKTPALQATTKARAMKMSLAIKMKCAFFFLTFPRLFPAVGALKMANKVELPYRVLGTAPKEIGFVPVLSSSKHCCKRNFTVVFVQVVKKSALDVQNLFFFIYLLGSVMNSNTF